MTPAQIINAHQNGCSARTIADHLGVHHSKIIRIIERGVDHMTPTDNVAELMSLEMKPTQIAKELDMTVDAVKSAIKRIKRALGPQAR